MTEGQKPERIEEIEKRYPNEWLAVLVTKTDRYNVPVEGILLAHSPDRREARQRAKGIEGLIYFTFAGPPVPPDMEVILVGNIPF